jgi:hypothetical protein
MLARGAACLLGRGGARGSQLGLAVFAFAFFFVA